MNDESHNEFKVILKELRTDRNLGQEWLAKEAGVNKGSVSYWENGLKEPKLHSIVLLAKYFNVSADYLVGLNNNFGKIDYDCKNEFKDVVKRLRIEKHMPQETLAKELGVSNGIISIWENGLREPSMRSLILLAKYFNVSINYLVGLSNDY